MARFLLVADVDQIQGYVFATYRLRAIRGASVLLEDLLRTLPDEGYKLDFLRKNGGQAVAILHDATQSATSEICHQWEKHFRSHSNHASTITVAVAEWPEDIGFKSALGTAFASVWRRKQSRQAPDMSGVWETDPTDLPRTGFYERRCEYCRSQPALPDLQRNRPFLSASPDRYWHICQACLAREAAIIDRRDPSISHDGRIFLKLHALGVGIPGPHRLPYELEELWPQGHEGNYLAYLSADGNSFGTLQEEIADPDLYRAFASSLEDLTYSAIALAAERSGLAARSRWLQFDGQTVLPFMPIILAGDDLAVLLPGQEGLKFALELCKAFSQGSMENEPIQEAISILCQQRPELGNQIFGIDPDRRRLTLSIGLSVAKASFPMSAHRTLVGELRSRAKGLVRHGVCPAEEGGMVDFTVITTATVPSLNVLRQPYEPDNGVRLTSRPYTIDSLEKLLSLAGVLREQVPRSRRKYLYEGLLQGEREGTDRYLFILRRDRCVAGRIDHAMKHDFGCEEGAVFNSRGITPLLDALEVAEMVSPS
jgi:hypothetical protein